MEFTNEVELVPAVTNIRKLHPFTIIELESEKIRNTQSSKVFYVYLFYLTEQRRGHGGNNAWSTSYILHGTHLNDVISSLATASLP